MTNYECENRISDDEIISSLEVIATTRNCSECKIRNCNWGDCNCSQITADAALDLINRLQAEIERLKINLRAVLDERADHTEPIKEFADRLKEKTYPFPCAIGDENAVTIRAIDETVKEMVGEE